MQAVLVQENFLKQAQAHIAELEQRLSASSAGSSSGFLNAGANPWGAAAAPRPQQQQQQQQPYQQQPVYQQPAPPQASPWGQPAAGGGGGFLRQAATAATGVAGGMLLATKMRMQVRVVELAVGVLRYAMAPGFSDDLRAEIRAGLERATGGNWQVERVADGGAPTLVEAGEGAKAAAEQALMASPLVEAALAAFPGAEIVAEEGVREAPFRRQA